MLRKAIKASKYRIASVCYLVQKADPPIAARPMIVDPPCGLEMPEPPHPHLHSVLRQVERLYTGPQTDSELVEHMKACNAKGPLVVHIAKLFPKSDCSAFDAFGRVFSGTVRPGDKVPVSLGGAKYRTGSRCTYVRLLKAANLSSAGEGKAWQLLRQPSLSADRHGC